MTVIRFTFMDRSKSIKSSKYSAIRRHKCYAQNAGKHSTTVAMIVTSDYIDCGVWKAEVSFLSWLIRMYSIEHVIHSSKCDHAEHG